MTPRPLHISALVLALMVGFAASSCSLSTEHKLTFEISGPPGADITYGVGSDQSQDNGATLPWKKDLTSKDDPLIAVLIAQSKSDGEIACKITMDGKVVKENKSTGEFAIVTCTTP